MDRQLFARAASAAARQSGRPWAFAAAAALVLAWALTGPVFGFSENWQLVINTGTSIVTFLMVFLIQNAQNRDTEAIQLKLDELIRATQGAQNTLIALESQNEDVVEQVRADIRQECQPEAAHTPG